VRPGHHDWRARGVLARAANHGQELQDVRESGRRVVLQGVVERRVRRDPRLARAGGITARTRRPRWSAASA
jgi:hypothetical protein